MIDEKACRECGSRFVPKSKKGKQVFCSSECRLVYWKKRTIKFGYEPKPLLKKKCVVCGEKFETNRKSRVTCGKKECARERSIRKTREKCEQRTRKEFSEGKIWVLKNMDVPMDEWEWELEIR